jgi:hypothetical protein
LVFSTTSKCAIAANDSLDLSLVSLTPHLPNLLIYNAAYRPNQHTFAIADI